MTGRELKHSLEGGESAMNILSAFMECIKQDASTSDKNAVETKSKCEDESSHTVGTKSETYGEDEAENISCNESQSIASSPKPKRQKKKWT